MMLRWDVHKEDHNNKKERLLYASLSSFVESWGFPNIGNDRPRLHRVSYSNYVGERMKIIQERSLLAPPYREI